MNTENFFVPKILLCGDKAEFLARVNQRPYQLVGQIEFSGSAENKNFNFLKDGYFAINGKLFNYNNLPKILTGGGAQIL